MQICARIRLLAATVPRLPTMKHNSASLLRRSFPLSANFLGAELSQMAKVNNSSKIAT